MPKTAAYVSGGLKQHGHTVDHAPDGQAGLMLAVGESYDVLVVDRMLPGLDGLALVKTVRGAGVKTPVLFLTALGGIDDRVRGSRPAATTTSSSRSPSPKCWHDVQRAGAPPADDCGRNDTARRAISKWTFSNAR